MKKTLFLFLFIASTLTINTTTFGQDANNNKTPHPFYVDYVMGPFLFVDDIAYEAVFMNGCRLGFNINQNFNFSIEYVAGQQSDFLFNNGMTHNANLQFSYHFLPKSQPFSPYLFTGSGFFEFKEFTTDVYGISWHLGMGTTLKINDRLSGLIESRYLNTGWLDVGGQNQLAVMWGARLSF